MKKAWTLYNNGVKRPDFYIAIEETKEAALNSLCKQIEDADKYSICIIIDNFIYRFDREFGYGYKGDDWDGNDKNPDMWDLKAACRKYKVVELPCYYMGKEYEVEDFFKNQDIVKPMFSCDFHKKFPDIVDMDEHVSNVYLDNGTILRYRDWIDDCYSSGGKYYYPVDIPISYYHDEDTDSCEPDQYETVGYIEG